MKIKVLRNIKWAYKGLHVMQLCDGVHDYPADICEALIERGYAEAYNEFDNNISDMINEHIDGISYPIVTKLQRGWWSVEYEDGDVVKVRSAVDHNDAIRLAEEKR